MPILSVVLNLTMELDGIRRVVIILITDDACFKIQKMVSTNHTQNLLLFSTKDLQESPTLGQLKSSFETFG